MSYRKSIYSVLVSLFLGTFGSIIAQQSSPSPSATPPVDEQRVRIFTEEVRLPVIAVDQFGHYDPTVNPEDILVLEDGLAQQVQSVRRIPANVILILDTGGGDSIGLGGQSKPTNLTRDVAMALLNQMKPGTWFSVMQFNNSVETLQPWTTDKESGLKVLKTKLSSGKRARFSDALMAAAQQLSDRPEGSRHVVLITDGVDNGARANRSEAVKRLMSVRATIHVISYTEFVKQKKEGRASATRGGQMPNSSDPIRSTDPTQPPGTTRSPTFGMSIRFDPEMTRRRKAYEADVTKSQQTLTTMADDTGGRIFLPKSADEMIAKTKEVAQEIGAEYVVTYKPKRPLAESRQGEYRRIEVASRRVGLTLRSRRGYVVPNQGNE